MQFLDFIKGTLLAISFTLLMMAANLANAKEISVPSLNQAIKKGTLITSELLSEINLPEKQINQLTIVNSNEILGKIAAKNINKNRALYKQNFKSKPVVMKGKLAKVVYNKGAISLSTEGYVMHDAAEGELVKFINLTSKRTLTGIALKNGTIMVN